MTTRTVLYILQKALRRVGEETDYAEAPEEAYQDAFDSLVDMLDEWNTRGYVLFQAPPKKMSDVLSSSDPVNALINNLAIKIAQLYHFEPSRAMVAQAGNSLRLIRNRVRKLPTWCRPCGMPRGSANYFYYRFLGEDSENVCTTTGIPIITGSNT